MFCLLLNHYKLMLKISDPYFQKLFTAADIAFCAVLCLLWAIDIFCTAEKRKVMQKLNVALGERSYPIYIDRHLLEHIGEYLDPARHYVLIADSGIPQIWVDLVRNGLDHCDVIRFEQGEASKSFAVYESLIRQLADLHLTRKDALIALGGGVTGDLCGFAAATYMRGIDFYQIPTTVLAQVDSSVGGKTAIDVGPLKNLCGAFWQPKAVLIDPQVLDTLDPRQISAGLVEALKMGAVFDEDLVAEFEKENPDIEKIIARSIDLKRQVVEEDEKESGKRKLLNFGHTIGHAIEGSYDDHDYLHGECVGMGMLYFIEDPDLKKRIRAIEERLNVPFALDYDADRVIECMKHDKKGLSDGVEAVFVRKAGDPEIRKVSYEALSDMIRKGPEYEE